MRLRLSRPTEPEKPGWHECDGEEGGDKPMFLCAQAVRLDVRFEVDVYVRHVYDDADDTADDDASEHDAQLTNVEVVDANVHEGEGFEEGVVYS